MQVGYKVDECDYKDPQKEAIREKFIKERTSD